MMGDLEGSERGINALNTKTRAILQVVNLAHQRKWKEIIIESDSEYLIQQLSGPQTNQDWRITSILENIRDNSNQFTSVR